MQLQIRAIGKLKKNTPEFALIVEYIKKTRWSVEIKEYEEKKSLAGTELKQAEAKLLLKDLPTNAYVIALDEHGRTLSSLSITQSIHTGHLSLRALSIASLNSSRFVAL